MAVRAFPERTADKQSYVCLEMEPQAEEKQSQRSSPFFSFLDREGKNELSLGLYSVMPPSIIEN